MNPCGVFETNNCNDKKVMKFVVIRDGQVPILHSFIEEDRKCVSVNGSYYLEVLEKNCLASCVIFINIKAMLVVTRRRGAAVQITALQFPRGSCCNPVLFQNRMINVRLLSTVQLILHT